MNTSRHVRSAASAIQEVLNLTEIDQWFLLQIEAAVDSDEDLTTP
jgi:hypothetical protein